MGWFFNLVRLALVLALVLWLTSQPGTAHIVWRGWEIETSAALLFLAGLVAVSVLFGFYRLWRFIADGPRFWALRKKIRLQTRGHDDLTRGFAALASGDGAEAGRLALAARKALGSAPLVRLLQAQAARLSGDDRAADEIFQALTHDPTCAAIGYRGLIMRALASGDWALAESHVIKLRAAKPNTPWLRLVEFELATRQERWHEAEVALTDAKKRHLVDAPRFARYQAALLLAQAYAVRVPERDGESLQLAEQAGRLVPYWTPAVLLLAAEQERKGHIRAASRLIERTWAITPHPDLAPLYGRLSRKSDPLGYYKQIEGLTRKNPDATISHLVLSEAALAADLWGAARNHLLAIASRADATQSVFRLLAKLERRETGDERAVSQWLSKIADALPDPRWICRDCGGSHQAWQANCLHCGTFNTLDWQIPGSRRREDPVQSFALPLLEGG